MLRVSVSEGTFLVLLIFAHDKDAEKPVSNTCGEWRLKRQGSTP